MITQMGRSFKCRMRIFCQALTTRNHDFMFTPREPEIIRHVTLACLVLKWTAWFWMSSDFFQDFEAIFGSNLMEALDDKWLHREWSNDAICNDEGIPWLSDCMIWSRLEWWSDSMDERLKDQGILQRIFTRRNLRFPFWRDPGTTRPV